MTAVAKVTRRVLLWRLARLSVIRYFLFIAGSSIHAVQNPLGFMLVAFFTIVIFIVVS